MTYWFTFVKNWPTETTPPKFHIYLEDHVANFVEIWSTGYSAYRQHGAESIS